MNKQFYYVNALQTAQEQTSVCNDFNEFIKLICSQKPLYEIISSGTKIKVNEFNKLALDFDGKDKSNLKDFTTLIETFKRIPIGFCCIGYVNFDIDLNLINLYDSEKRQLIYFDKTNYENNYSCHLTLNLKITSDEFKNLKHYNIFNLNFALDSEALGGFRKFRHPLCDKDSGYENGKLKIINRKLNLTNLKKFLTSVNCSKEEFFKMSIVQYIDEDFPTFSEFSNFTTCIYKIENEKQITQTTENDIKSIFYFLNNEIITEENEITSFELAGKLKSYSHSCLTYEEFVENIELLPWYHSHPDQVKRILDMIDFNRDITNISPLLKSLKEYFDFYNEQCEIIKCRFPENETKIEIKKLNTRYKAYYDKLTSIIGHYQPIAFAIRKFYPYNENNKKKYILDNICFLCDVGEYYIKNKFNNIERISKTSIKQKFRLSSEYLEKYLINITNYENFEEYSFHKTKFTYENNKEHYDKLAKIYVDILKRTFNSEQEFNIYFNILHQKVIHPNKSTQYSIICCGPANCAKTTGIESLKNFVKFQKINSIDSLTSNFNSSIDSDILLIEEIKEYTKGLDKIIEVLKSIIKTKYVEIEMKGKDKQTIDNHLTLIMNTNFKTIGGLFRNKQNCIPLLSRFRILSRKELTDEDKTWISANIYSDEGEFINMGFYNYILENDFEYSSDSTDIEQEILDTSVNETEYYKVFSKEELTEQALTTTKSRHIRINLRYITTTLNQRNIELVDKKFNITTLKNHLINANIARVDGTHTNCIDVEKFITLFEKTEVNESEDEILDILN